MTKSGPAAVSVGSTATYNVTVTNNGGVPATEVSLADTLTGPALIHTITADQGSCSISSGNGQQATCTLGTLAPGESAEITVVAEPTRGPTGMGLNTITNTVEATAANDPSASSDSVTTALTNTNGCTIIGTSGNDTINGTTQSDVICSLGGADIINAANGNDTVYAGTGNDIVHGNNGNDTLNGGPGNDTITGDNGNDSLRGEDGNDSLNGNAGVNTNNGGPGSNTCTNPTTGPGC
ncbi:calcium-binding protein [Streptomyces sp. NPDC086023]|uniref:calcium-binding protein n=1 Tax=Streptomyces sp. NPDC086023 TaxID=3365746 RepID=UPI0037D91E6D